MFRCIIPTNSPFTFSGNKQFKRLVEMLRPGTTVPNRNKISDELVDKIYDEEKLKVAAVVNGLPATIVIDGWSTLDNQPVFGISFYSGGKSFLVNTIDTSGEPHTTKYLVDVLDSEVKRCQIWLRRIICQQKKWKQFWTK